MVRLKIPGAGQRTTPFVLALFAKISACFTVVELVATVLCGQFLHPKVGLVFILCNSIAFRFSASGVYLE
jgi:hypothetical protein